MELRAARPSGLEPEVSDQGEVERLQEELQAARKELRTLRHGYSGDEDSSPEFQDLDEAVESLSLRRRLWFEIREARRDAKAEALRAAGEAVFTYCMRHGSTHPPRVPWVLEEFAEGARLAVLRLQDS